MKNKLWFWALAIVLAVVSFPLGRVIWPDMPGMAAPAPELIPLFMVVGAFESLAFGFGVAFAVFGWKHVRAVVDDARGALLTYLSIIWLLVSWWPHDNMHRVNGMSDFAGLLRIEYAFHVTLIIATTIVAFNFWKRVARTS